MFPPSYQGNYLTWLQLASRADWHSGAHAIPTSQNPWIFSKEPWFGNTEIDNYINKNQFEKRNLNPCYNLARATLTLNSLPSSFTFIFCLFYFPGFYNSEMLEYTSAKWARNQNWAFLLILILLVSGIQNVIDWYSWNQTVRKNCLCILIQA